MLNTRLAIVKVQSSRDHFQSSCRRARPPATEEAFRAAPFRRPIAVLPECAELAGFQTDPAVRSGFAESGPWCNHDGGAVAKIALRVPSSTNRPTSSSKAVALCLRSSSDVCGGTGNLVGQEHFAIQGYRLHRIRPISSFKEARTIRPVHRVMVIERKGRHLEGNRDTG